MWAKKQSKSRIAGQNCPVTKSAVHDFLFFIFFRGLPCYMKSWQACAGARVLKAVLADLYLFAA
jgi:hypothetical protein